MKERLVKDFQDKEYREGYANEFLNTSIAAQLVTLREQRGLSQSQIADLIGTKQPSISRFEDVNYTGWKIATLEKIAFALGCRLKVSFETFGSLIEEASRFSRASLERPSFEDDPVFAQNEELIM